MAATFGRKVSHDEEMARRREAFIAAERARRASAGEASPPGASPAFASASPVQASAAPRVVVLPEKSVGMAYLLWFFLGALSIHRFYLGYAASGAVQVGLWLVGWGTVISGSAFGVFLLIGWMIWLFGDAFLIPAMARRKNEEARAAATSYAFA